MTLCDALLFFKRSRPWKRSATIFGRTVMCDFPLKDCSPPVFLLKHWKQDVKEVLRERDEWQVWSIYLELGRLTGRHQEVLWRGSTILCQNSTLPRHSVNQKPVQGVDFSWIWMMRLHIQAHSWTEAAIMLIFSWFQRPSLLIVLETIIPIISSSFV